MRHAQENARPDLSGVTDHQIADPSRFDTLNNESHR